MANVYIYSLPRLRRPRHLTANQSKSPQYKFDYYPVFISSTFARYELPYNEPILTLIDFTVFVVLVNHKMFLISYLGVLLMGVKGEWISVKNEFLLE